MKQLTYHKSLLLCLCFTISISVFSQEKSNKGKEFWLGYGYNYSFNNEPPVNQQNLVLYLSAEEPANVTVSVNGTTWTQSVSIPAHTVNASVIIPKSGTDDARIFNEGLFTKGIHVVSDTPIVAYAHLYNTMVSGATMLMPVETYGYKYYSLNYAQNTSATSPPTTPTATTTQNGPDWYSWFYVVASEDNTRLEITPADTTRNGWLPGQTYTVNLNKGEIYNVMGKLVNGTNTLWAASKDMTGSKILSIPGADGTCHPVAVFCGSSGIRICKNDGGEYMQQQVFPTQAWGTRYLTYHTMNNTNTNINDQFKNFYRIAVTDPTTVVKRNGIQLTGLINNFYYEYLDSLGGDYLEADKPILVAQYTPGGNRCYLSSQFAYGDPEMFYLSAMEQGKKDVLFYATRNSFIDYNYLNVIIPAAGIPSLRLDGSPFSAANIIPHPHLPGYSVAVARMLGAAGQHRLVSDSNFTATVYGLGYFESYGYNVGTYINNLNYYSEIKNVFSANLTDSISCPKTPLRVYLKLGYQATSINWKLSQVPGLQPNVDSMVSNPVPVRTELINGRTYYVYSLQQDFMFSTPGTYTIPVTFTSLAIENCSRMEQAQIKIIIKPGPLADFSVTGNTCQTDSIHFNGNPSAQGFNLINYTWFFDDNTTSNSLNTVKKFITAGQHPVRFRILADNGCAGDTTKTITIQESPVARFGLSGSVCSGDSVLISDSSFINSGSVGNRQWLFGDGNSQVTTSNQPFYHRYGAPGTYTVSLVSFSLTGCKSDTAKKTIIIEHKPVAKFGYDRTICAGDSIRFSDSSFIVSGGIVSWIWNFGDGTTASYTSNNPFYHRFTAAGIYHVVLDVQSAKGCLDTFGLNVYVNSRPTAGFTINGKPCVDSIFSFTSTIPFNSNNPATYSWWYGDGQSLTTAASSTATHVYTAAQANILVKHLVSYGAGCVSDTSIQILPKLVQNPLADFTLSKDKICSGETITITSTTPSANLTWFWDFGNGTGNGLPPFSKTFITPGNYNIILKVQTFEGCNSTAVTKTLSVKAAPLIDAGPDKYVAKATPVLLDAVVSNSGNLTYLWTPPVFLNNASILHPLCTPDTTTKYKLTVTDLSSLCSNTDSVTVFVVYKLYVPNAFTPNGDGKNDVWKIPGLALYPDALVSIYNRWGQLIYSTKNYISHPWNGLINGLPQPNDTFVYLIQLNDGGNQVIKGTLTIIR